MKEFTEKKDFFRFINNYSGELRIVNCSCFDKETNELVAIMVFDDPEVKAKNLFEKIKGKIKQWLE